MHKSTLYLLGALTLSGCASIGDDWFSTESAQQPDSMQKYSAAGMNVVNVRDDLADEAGQAVKLDQYGNAAGNSAPIQRGGYLSQYTGRNVNDYVQMLTQDLIGNMEYVTDKTPVGVTSFALLDSDLQQTNILGLQLAESFMHELHKFRIPVIDYKSTQFIRVTPKGDFLLSRDFMELDTKTSINYVLTGTLTRHSGGYLINARVLGMKSKAVVASAQALIPFHVVDALLGEAQQRVDGVQLKQG